MYKCLQSLLPSISSERLCTSLPYTLHDYNIPGLSNCPALLLKDDMSFTLTSIRTIAHASFMARAPALFIGLSKLSQTVLRPLGRSNFSTVAQQKAPKAPKAVIVPQKFLARRVRQQYPIQQKCSRSAYQQKPRILAATTYRCCQSGRAGFWFNFNLTFWPVLFVLLYTGAGKSSKAKPSLKTDGPQDKSKED
ncbi:hypothetical protein PMIN06_007511 [Paraphaeosphaeria minitans]